MHAPSPTRSGFRLDPIGGIMGHARLLAKDTLAQMRGGAGTRRRSLALLNSQSPLLGYFTEREVGAIIERGVLVTVARPGVRQRLLGEN